MRKVELSMKEMEKYTIIKRLVEKGENKERTRVNLGLKSIMQHKTLSIRDIIHILSYIFIYIQHLFNYSFP